LEIETKEMVLAYASGRDGPGEEKGEMMLI
jgi:hypothetical protein